MNEVANSLRRRMGRARETVRGAHFTSKRLLVRTLSSKRQLTIVNRELEIYFSRSLPKIITPFDMTTKLRNYSGVGRDVLGKKILRMQQDTANSENKPRGLYFSKALFEGLIFGGAYVRREICV